MTTEDLRALLARVPGGGVFREPVGHYMLTATERALFVLAPELAAGLAQTVEALEAAERERDDVLVRAAEDQDAHSAQRAAMSATLEGARTEISRLRVRLARYEPPAPADAPDCWDDCGGDLDGLHTLRDRGCDDCDERDPPADAPACWGDCWQSPGPYTTRERGCDGCSDRAKTP